MWTENPNPCFVALLLGSEGGTDEEGSDRGRRRGGSGACRRAGLVPAERAAVEARGAHRPGAQRRVPDASDEAVGGGQRHGQRDEGWALFRGREQSPDARHSTRIHPHWVTFVLASLLFDGKNKCFEFLSPIKKLIY